MCRLLLFFIFFFLGFGNCTSPDGTQITVDFKSVEDLKKAYSHSYGSKCWKKSFRGKKNFNVGWEKENTQITSVTMQMKIKDVYGEGI